MNRGVNIPFILCLSLPFSLKKGFFKGYLVRLKLSGRLKSKSDTPAYSVFQLTLLDKIMFILYNCYVYTF